MAMEDSNVAPKNKSFEIILGSSSAARREILAEMGYEFSIMTADIDEKGIRKENPEELVSALAEAKADALMIKLEATGKLKEMSRPTLLITADTVVVYQGTIREKPSNEREARQFITDYSGSSARVVGSVLVTNLVTGCRKGGWDSAEVYFLDIPEEVVDSLIEEGITFNVAGGLMLEHPLIFPLVDTVIGTADCVMGLSKTLTENLIRDAL
ncbi:uncharacterized protein LOC127258268 isoform X1 [Andrographis paniculata]|uniref:uncharacterized protein LOC127258268 isoform X1 n=1 Tax=Andrographis paniculata TaxID=175694 RepID=UPI0021E8ABDE|nr:uncharacterized protein LOC127258268 isoform X1 [Andrographis paniculata]XP_051141016.1 uncharacterized protein LOC127258268 isoform X1 [Andrographis paniculata]XP_051141017.1 uncharacterized protein LOC127258268 isoform X1 [Andrographis paniculata]